MSRTTGALYKTKSTRPEVGEVELAIYPVGAMHDQRQHHCTLHFGNFCIDLPSWAESKLHIVPKLDVIT